MRSYVALKYIYPSVCVCSVSPYLHTIRGREKGPGVVCQQCETHHGQVSIHFKPNDPEPSGTTMNTILIFLPLGFLQSSAGTDYRLLV